MLPAAVMIGIHSPDQLPRLALFTFTIYTPSIWTDKSANGVDPHQTPQNVDLLNILAQIWGIRLSKYSCDIYLDYSCLDKSLCCPSKENLAFRSTICLGLIKAAFLKRSQFPVTAKHKPARKYMKPSNYLVMYLKSLVRTLACHQ